ncbi:MAG: pantoate--beta-alanine ligase [Candidatus Kaelpia aquatica]|nr:pantoate--beta-alanine ligase [Candidatus Kaelpia aquatica]
MKIFKAVKSLQDNSLRLKLEGKSIGFVPTMGYLHQGHISLIRAARKESNVVVLSIFVNPVQFSPGEDCRRYPRDFKRDCSIARNENVDIVFYPSSGQIYPQEYSSYVEVNGLSSLLCGKSRPNHFRGVATVCTKLFNIVQPDFVYFGQKDYQQAIIIRRMIKDLNMPFKIRVLPLLREESGLAMSSRNRYLSKTARENAAAIYKGLKEAKDLFKNGQRDAAKIKAMLKKKIKEIPNVRIDYVDIVDSKSLKSLSQVKKQSILAVAIWIDKIRLIDNIVF